jgi:uncharacterized protein YjbI with pentapeptide repeats
VLRDPNSEEANFDQAYLSETDFKGASLQRANFDHAEIMMVDFTNADLLDGYNLTDEKLQARPDYGDAIILTNARFSNGIFGHINSSNLVVNGYAELEVRNLNQALFSFLKPIISV